MKLAPTTRRGFAAFAAMLTAALLVPAQPAAADPEIIASVAPQSGPTAGGSPIRIYGTGFGGATDVEFGTEAATDFAVIDSTLITAVVPAAAGGTNDDNTFVDISVTAANVTDTQIDGFYYTNATFDVSPDSGLKRGDSIATTLTGYKINTDVVVPEFNPLLVYIEDFPSFSPPPPYADVLEGVETTDGSGDLTVNTSLNTTFGGDDSYDDNIQCPVNQTTANYLGNSDSVSLSKPAYSGRCMVANGQFGMGTLERAIEFDADPTPAAPTLAFSPTSDIDRGETVDISGIRWNANPFFGSSKLADNPGETTTIVDICTSGSSCSSTLGDATVAPTRYIYNGSLTPPAFEFSGASLDGTIQVGMDLPSPCTNCFLRVRQTRPAGGTLQAFVTIPID